MTAPIVTTQSAATNEVEEALAAIGMETAGEVKSRYFGHGITVLDDAYRNKESVGWHLPFSPAIGRARGIFTTLDRVNTLMWKIIREFYIQAAERQKS